MEDTTGKELVLTTPSAVVKQRSKPTLVQVGNRTISSDGRFHPDLLAEHLLTHGRQQWIGVAPLVKVFGHDPTIANKRRVRKNMFRVFTILLSRGEFLLYETGHRGRINAVKLLDARSLFELQAVGPQVDRMKQKHQLTTAKYQQAIEVIELHKQAVAQ